MPTAAVDRIRLERSAFLWPHVVDRATTVRSTEGPLEKTLGTTTGVKTIDVSPAAQEAQPREMLQTILRDEAGGKVFSKVVVPNESLQSLSPGERLLQATAVLDALSRNKVTLDQLGY